MISITLQVFDGFRRRERGREWEGVFQNKAGPSLWKIPLRLHVQESENHQWARPPEGAEPPLECPADDIPDDALGLPPLPPLFPRPLKPPDEPALE